MIPTQEYETILGPLKNTKVPIYLKVIGHFGPILPHSTEAVDGTGEKLDMMHKKIEIILLEEYGDSLPPEHQITVRWHNDQWVVVGTPSERVRRVTFRAAVN